MEKPPVSKAKRDNDERGSSDGGHADDGSPHANSGKLHANSGKLHANSGKLARYDWSKSYRWNYEHPPCLSVLDIDRRAASAVPGDWDYLGLPVGSPLGVAAGPLLNGDWCRYYAELGFDVVTYKTVRSGPRECYPLPNLQPVECDRMSGVETRVAPQESMTGSWAVSYGMPSSHPDTWRRDIEQTREALASDRVLSVSVVGTIKPDWSMQELADDYALCARWALESGADCIEANFSCPNVATCDGQLYQDVHQSRLVAKTIREAIGATPLIIKIGFVPLGDSVIPLVGALGDVVDALAMTNSIAATVGPSDEQLMYGGEQRGICGSAIRESSIGQVGRFASAIKDADVDLRLVGVGGISAAEHVLDYLKAGAHACHLATAVMTDPTVGLAIRNELASSLPEA